MAPTSGILYVTMEPKPGLPSNQFHDWYNNEHGPSRVRMSIFDNGFRYRATDLDGPGKGMPEWMAIYDVPDMNEMVVEPYIGLRKPPIQSQRERDTMKQIAVDRKFYDLENSWESANFKKLENIDAVGTPNVMIAVILIPQPGQKEEIDKWYIDEHVELLQKVPGWLRTRRFVSSSVDPRDEIECMALHEYSSENGLGGPEFQAATTTSWYNKIFDTVVKTKKRRAYELVYTFGRGPRDLSVLHEPFSSYDKRTKTVPPTNSGGAIESYITTPDGAVLSYRLEGSTDPEGPVLVFSNCVLVDWGIWDSFVKEFTSIHSNHKYRILRYLTRGRTKEYGKLKVNLDVLSSDIICLLDGLRIPQAACAIGVSLGGATVLNTALKYPNRISRFISCDTNANSPSGNRKAWGERIDTAKAEGLKSEEGDAIVGSNLAEATTRRWFVAENYKDPAIEPELRRVKDMVINNDLAGFETSVEALFDYDIRSEMQSHEGKGIFVVGGSDGVLPDTMKTMAQSLGTHGTACHVIDNAGHLPMVENPKVFSQIVSDFLA